MIDPKTLETAAQAFRILPMMFTAAAAFTTYHNSQNKFAPQFATANTSYTAPTTPAGLYGRPVSGISARL